MPQQAVLRPALSPALDAILPAADCLALERELSDSLHTAQKRYASNPHLEPGYRRLAEFVLAGGKRVRPRLALAAFRILSGREPSRGVLQVAASLELFHAFMLIHDDLIDGSEMRRDRPTLHEAIRLDGDDPTNRKTPADLALLGGDLLFALGMRVVSRADVGATVRSRAQRFLADMLFETGVGEMLDVLYDHSPLEQIGEGQIIEAYLRKTSRYSVAGPLVLGAILAGAPAASCRALSRLGDLLGLAYQIQNDLDELTGDPAAPCPDLDSGKRTLVLWQAHRGLDAGGQASLKRALELPVGPKRRCLLLELVDRSGARNACTTRLRRIRQDALAALGEARFPPDQHRALTALTLWIGGCNAPRTLPEASRTGS